MEALRIGSKIRSYSAFKIPGYLRVFANRLYEVVLERFLRISSKIIQGKAAHCLCSHSAFKIPKIFMGFIKGLCEVVLNASKHSHLDHKDSQTILETTTNNIKAMDASLKIMGIMNSFQVKHTQ